MFGTVTGLPSILSTASVTNASVCVMSGVPMSAYTTAPVIPVRLEQNDVAAEVDPLHSQGQCECARLLPHRRK